MADWTRRSEVRITTGKVAKQWQERHARRDSPLICAEVAVLFSICTLDMISSAWLFHHGLATEKNPLLRGAAEAGTLPFVLVKLVSFVPGLIAAEWYRRVRPVFSRYLLRFVIAAYLTVYGIGVASQFIR